MDAGNGVEVLEAELRLGGSQAELGDQWTSGPVDQWNQWNQWGQ